MAVLPAQTAPGLQPEHHNQLTTYSMQLKELKKCSRKKNIKSFPTRGSLRMQAVKLATTADISLSLPICLRGTFQYVTFMHYSLATFFLFMQSIILKCPDCKTKACIKFFTCIFSEAYIQFFIVNIFWILQIIVNFKNYSYSKMNK